MRADSGWRHPQRWDQPNEINDVAEMLSGADDLVRGARAAHAADSAGDGAGSAIRQVFKRKIDAPKWPADFIRRSMREVSVKNKQLLAKLREVEPGDWKKVYDDAHEMNLTIEDRGLPTFLTCLGIGVLHAIQRGILPPQAGVWTLARPAFWEPLEASKVLPPHIISAFQTCDELAALQQVSPEALEAELAALISKLEDFLQSQSDAGWEVRWQTSASQSV